MTVSTSFSPLKASVASCAFNHAASQSDAPSPHNLAQDAHNDFQEVMTALINFCGMVSPILVSLVVPFRKLYLQQLLDLADTIAGNLEYFQKTIAQNLLSMQAVTWDTSVEPLSDKFVATQKEELYSALDVADFPDEDDNSCLLLFNDMMKEDSLQSGSLLSEIFVAELASAAPNAQILVNTLDLLKFYNYDALRPFSQLIAAAALSCRFERVKAHALSLIGHWGDRRALNLLNKLDPGSNTFVCGMYASVKESLERLCC